MFKESNLLENDVELSSDKLAHIFKSVIGLPSTFIALNKNNQWNITQTIRAIVPEIERSCGSSIAGEVEKILCGMTGALEETLSKLQQRLDEHEQNVIYAIENQKNQEIQALKAELTAKDEHYTALLAAKDQQYAALIATKDCQIGELIAKVGMN